MLNRNDRQDITVDKILKSQINCAIDCCTGYGKTWVAGRVIRWALAKIPEYTVNVIVPTNPIKVQWEKFAEYLGLSENITVYVINGVVKNNVHLKADIVIWDKKLSILL